MGPQEQILALATAILHEKQQPQTIEALTQEVSKRFGRPLPAPQVGRLLQSKPQIFIVDGGGRWQLRQQQNTLIVEEATPAPSQTGSTYTLRWGCYIVFDLEATRQDALSPYTEIIQIAAERWLDGVCKEKWMSFVRPIKAVQERIHQLTKIKAEELAGAPPIEEVLPQFLAFVGDLPLIAHNGASYDGPLLQATCQRLNIPLPETFLVLDTLPLARTLLPTLEAHRVGTLYEYFGDEVRDAHRADADVAMLSTIVQHLERLLHEESSGQAVSTFLRRANDPWTYLLAPPDGEITSASILATFGAKITPLLNDPVTASGGSIDSAAVEEIFALEEDAGRTRRDAQVTMSQEAADILRTGGYAIIQAGTGTGKGQGYLIPAALYARASGRPVAVSTYTRVLQEQLVKRELPFIQQLIPQISYAQLQGRANYLSLSRLAEEVEDALAENYLPPYRAWMLATLIRFAATSEHGNLEELGIIPQALDSFLHSDGAVYQIVASMRASQDDRPNTLVQADFYRRARANADRASLVVVNHALLLRNSLAESEDEETPFAATVICDEAHTLEDAASTALEKRIEERVSRRLLRAIYTPRGGGLVNDCVRRLHMSQENETLQQLVQSVDKIQAALTSLGERLHAYVNNQTVVSREDIEQELFPRFTQGAERHPNREYARLQRQAVRLKKKGDMAQAERLMKKVRELPSGDPNDPTYRRLHYVRYADDTLIGLIGTKKEAKEIKERLGTYLHETLKLELSEEKTLITHAATQAARFLGYELVGGYRNNRLFPEKNQPKRIKRRRLNGTMRLRVPAEVLEEKRREYQQRGKPLRRMTLAPKSDSTILRTYQDEYRGLYQYYQYAENVCWLNTLHWDMEQSLVHTLATKYQTRCTAILKRLKTTVETPHGMRTCLQVTIRQEGKKPRVATFGGIPLKRNKQAVLVDRVPTPIRYEQKEVIRRLMRGTCELCEVKEEACVVHQVKKLVDLERMGKKRPLWAYIMLKRRRKTLIVCQPCHSTIHRE